MSQLVTPYGTLNLIQYETEQEFERAIVAHVTAIFGERRIYLDCKRRIGASDSRYARGALPKRPSVKRDFTVPHSRIPPVRGCPPHRFFTAFQWSLHCGQWDMGGWRSVEENIPFALTPGL